ncbi:MAG TPA: CPBP family intramembrane glutamic endopeptidase [Acidimicrobiia bacterium]|nr:CPBP family intramembrane glutamic endopeptidase [Acidimicrobiia bacterium]
MSIVDRPVKETRGGPEYVTVGAGVVAALFLLGLLQGFAYAVAVSAGMLVAVLLLRIFRGRPPLFWWRPDARDLIVVGVLYVAVVAVIRLAFVGFTTENMVGLFISYAVVGLLLLGVAAPVLYNVRLRHRPLRSLGVGLHNWRPTLALGLVIAAVQFALTLWGYDLPRPVDWVPLLLMSLTVGLFESIFFRGFIQNRLEASFGPVLGVGLAAALYGLYHFGYAMGSEEIVFLAGLGVVYAVAFRATRNVLVLWPLLTPLGSLFNNLEAGDIVLPWASMAGFGQVLAAMGVVLWLAHRYWKRQPKVTMAEGSADEALDAAQREVVVSAGSQPASPDNTDRR